MQVCQDVRDRSASPGVNGSSVVPGGQVYCGGGKGGRWPDVAEKPERQRVVEKGARDARQVVRMGRGA